MVAEPVRVDIWSDVACPWCWLGAAHLKEAARQTGTQLQIAYHAYQLAPNLQGVRPVQEYLRQKYGSDLRESQARLTEMGAKVGLTYRFDRALAANTWDAHRLHHFAKTHDKGPAMMEALFAAQHRDGLDVSDVNVLRSLAEGIGLDAAEISVILDSDAHGQDVEEDLALAQSLRIQGVPFFVFDGKHAASGAQPVEMFARILGQLRQPV